MTTNAAVRLAIPNLSHAYSAGPAGTKTCVCALCGRHISTHGSAMERHAETHVGRGDMERVTPLDGYGRPELVGYRTPGTPAYYVVWFDKSGAERPQFESCYASAEKAMHERGADTKRSWGSAEVRAVPA